MYWIFIFAKLLPWLHPVLNPVIYYFFGSICGPLRHTLNVDGKSTKFIKNEDISWWYLTKITDNLVFTKWGRRGSDESDVSTIVDGEFSFSSVLSSSNNNASDQREEIQMTSYTVHCRRPSGGYQQPFPGKSLILDKIKFKHKDVNTSPVVNGQTTDLIHLLAAMNARTVKRTKNVSIYRFHNTIHCDEFLKFCWEIHSDPFQLHQLLNQMTRKTPPLMKDPLEEIFDCQTGMFQQKDAWKDAVTSPPCSNVVRRCLLCFQTFSSSNLVMCSFVCDSV